MEHAEWLRLPVEQKATLRQQQRFAARAGAAKLRLAATIEDVDYFTPRDLDRTMFLRLGACDWIGEHRHCLITGPFGAGKPWLACALGDRVAGRTSRCSTCAAQDSLPAWRWPVAMAAMPGGCGSLPASIC